MKKDEPFFSICIPQHNRTNFLIEACKTLNFQSFRDFEICISDDCSTDGKEEDLINYLKATDMVYTYQKNERNLKYDGNLRASINMAKGRYCFLLGNDDALFSSATLEKVYAEIIKHRSVGAVVTNYEDYESGQKYDRVKETRVVGSGPTVASVNFRNTSFVSGVVLKRESCMEFKTEKWDGSEMYQMYLFSRIVASGENLLNVSDCAIRMGITINGEQVESYATREKDKFQLAREVRLPMVQIGRLVSDAIGPYLDAEAKSRVFEKIILQLYLFTYPFWFFEYRKTQSWMYALGLSIGLKPRNVFFGLGIGPLRTIRLYLVYWIVVAVGLTMPVSFFEWAKKHLYRIAKRAFSDRK